MRRATGLLVLDALRALIRVGNGDLALAIAGATVAIFGMSIGHDPSTSVGLLLQRRGPPPSLESEGPLTEPGLAPNESVTSGSEARYLQSDRAWQVTPTEPDIGQVLGLPGRGDQTLARSDLWTTRERESVVLRDTSF